MSHIREKQLSQLRTTIFIPLILFLVAWVAFFVILYINAAKAGIPLPSIWGIEIFAFALVSTAILYLYVPLFKPFLALKAISSDTPCQEKTIYCVKVKFIQTSNRKVNYRKFCAVILTAENGDKYTYVLEKVEFKDKQNCAPYKAYEGDSITLVCYGDTMLVERIINHS